MVARFASETQRTLFAAVRDQLRRIGYSKELLAFGYEFSDWFLTDTPSRTAAMAAFGQMPASYETACFAVVLSNGLHGPELVQEFRALGAPFAFEVGSDSIRQWVVGHNRAATRLVNTFGPDALATVFEANSENWSPAGMLRSKNVAFRPAARQLELFGDYDLIPELEDRVRAKLDPMVQDACAAARSAYFASTGNEPNGQQLFRLAFWMLAGKVLHDREIAGFSSLSSSSAPTDVLEKVAEHYGEHIPRLLNDAARQAVHNRLWTNFNFRHLSTEVLTHIWTNTFVTPAIRSEYGIHPTPRSIAKFIVDALPFEDIPEQDRIVMEPCCGCGAFLVAAFQRFRDCLAGSTKQIDRHTYLKEPFDWI